MSTAQLNSSRTHTHTHANPTTRIFYLSLLLLSLCLLAPKSTTLCPKKHSQQAHFSQPKPPTTHTHTHTIEDLFREPPTEFKPIISSLYMRVFENGSLIIYNTQRSDAGYYLCQANNGVGAGLSRVIKLTVNGEYIEI